ncbi:MAG: hypothetical protein B7Z75_13255 [Acidocella sp. 20-57-95]|nr:MAG: hypothetical protein B7Z75_13255 [Acidocella sp. 20-57-95]
MLPKPRDTPPQYSNSLARQYAQEHHRFLTESNPKFLANLRQSGELESHLHSVGEQAAAMYETIMMQGSQTKAMQNLPFQQKLEALQSLQQSTQESVRNDLIYQPVP